MFVYVALITPNAAIAPTKYVACSSTSGTSPRPGTRTCANSTSPEPSRAVKITRNINGKANVKNAEAGFRQNALFV